MGGFIIKFIVGSLVIALGLSILRFIMLAKRFVGKWEWAEQLFGQGGTYSGLKIFALVLVIGGFLYMTGTLDQVMLGIFRAFFRV